MSLPAFFGISVGLILSFALSLILLYAGVRALVCIVAYNPDGSDLPS